MELKSTDTEKIEGKNMTIDMVPIADLVPYETNPRKNEKAVDIVAKSIKEFGFKVPVIVDDKNVIVCGHTRIKAAIKLKMTKVPVIYASDLSDEQIKAFRIMDNKSQEYSGWDWDLLKLEFEGMNNVSLTGFTEAEIEKVMDFKETSTQGKKEPKYDIKEGDVYQLGNHRIICGDSTKEDTYLKLMPSGTNIQCVFTDPPYGVSYSGISNQGRKSPERGNNREWDVIDGDDLRGDELYKLLYESFKQINQVLIKNGALYVFHSSSNQIIFEKALNEANFQVKQQLIWNKHHVLGRSHYHWCHEPMFYCSRINENPDFFGTRSNRTIVNEIDPDTMELEELRRLVKKIKKESTMWDVKKDNAQDYIHPTQKPTQLAQRAIINSSKVGDSILDPFAGSGSTLMACEARGRNCYTIELDPVFCSLIIERWEDSTGNKGVKVENKTQLDK